MSKQPQVTMIVGECRSRLRATAHRAAFTLFEVILSLALSILLMLILGMAVNIHLRVTEVGRSDVERAQLARALLRKIGDDLRGAVWYAPAEASVPSLSSAGEAGAGGRSGGGGGPPGSGGSGISAGGGGGGSGGSGGSEMSTSEASGSLLPTTPGLFGDQYILQVDVSRLPRPELYDLLVQQDASVLTADMVSEVRTVAYYLGSSSGAGNSYSSGGAVGGGLVRRDLDRAVTQWAAESGGMDLLDPVAAPLAEEVAGLEFRYFDGTEWVYEWDSSERQGLPVAVEIAIAVGSADDTTSGASLFDLVEAPDSTDGDYTIYRLLVHLPIAQPTTLESSSTSSDGGGSP